jgi:hypothetical protein
LFFFFLSPVLAWVVLPWIFFFPSLSPSSLLVVLLCLSVKLSRLSFLNPCPLPRNVHLDQHKDEEIVGTCKMLASYLSREFEKQYPDPSNSYDLPAPCVYLPVEPPKDDALGIG